MQRPMVGAVTYETVLARGDCSVARAMEVVGERWTFLVLREAFNGVRRFEDMQRNLGIARNVLAGRLGGLVDHGVLERCQYQERPVRSEYRLTAKGVDLYPALVGLLQWGERWLADGEAPVELVHQSCGRATTLRVSCATCGQPVTGSDVRPRPGGEPAAAPAGGSPPSIQARRR